jgi:hypothetical protein
MSELEIKNEVECETEAFADELSDEALDREAARSYGASWLFCRGASRHGCSGSRSFV